MSNVLVRRRQGPEAAGTGTRGPAQQVGGPVAALHTETAVFSRGLKKTQNPNGRVPVLTTLA